MELCSGQGYCKPHRCNLCGVQAQIWLVRHPSMAREDRWDCSSKDDALHRPMSYTVRLDIALG